MNIETMQDLLDNLIKFNPNNKSIVIEQIDALLNDINTPTEEINDYYILELPKDYFVVKKDKTIYKSFFTKQDALDYCLDKINTESKQIDLL